MSERLIDNHYELPVVTDDMHDALVADIQELGFRAFVEQADTRMRVHNPGLYESVDQYILGLGLTDPEALFVAHRAMVMTHELLRRQAETNSMNSKVMPSPGDTPNQ